MSTEEEKAEAIAHDIEAARKEINKLELIKSVTKLSLYQERCLAMAMDVVERGEMILRNLRLNK